MSRLLNSRLSALKLKVRVLINLLTQVADLKAKIISKLAKSAKKLLQNRAKTAKNRSLLRAREAFVEILSCSNQLINKIKLEEMEQ